MIDDGAMGTVVELFPSRGRAQLALLVGALEELFCTCRPWLLEALADVEAEIETAPAEPAGGVLEQAAFIRVGLRCIADAIAELAAHATQLQPLDGPGPATPPEGDSTA